MKKSFNFFLLTLITIFIVGINQVSIDYSKVEFRNSSLNLFSEISEEVATEDLDFEKVSFKVSLDVEDFYYPCDLGMEATNDEVEEYKKASRAAAKKYYSTVNNKILEKVNVVGYESRYVSTYSNIIEFNYTVANYIKYGESALANLSSSNSIETIAVLGIDSEYHTKSLEDSLRKIYAYGDYSNRTYTGSGVTVGILEPGVVDATHSNFVNTNLLVRDEWYYVETVAEHTTQMASLISGTNGIAPNATILSVETFGSLTGEIDWLLDNGVDVVNMSYCENDNFGIYSDESAYIDSIAYNYNVTFIAAAGNSSQTNQRVSNPALGYNVIAVGASTKNDGLAYFTSYIDEGYTFKPDIVMTGTDIAVPGYNIAVDGTSASCAMTTGIVALIMERYPALKTKPAMIKAMLCATSQKINTQIADVNNGFNDAAGAGRLDYNRLKVAYAMFSKNLTAKSSQSVEFYEQTIELFEGETLSVCLSWLAYANGDKDETKFSMYYFRILDENRQIVDSRACSLSNVVFTRYIVPADGDYTIQVVRFTSGMNMINPTGEYVALDFRMD